MNDSTLKKLLGIATLSLYLGFSLNSPNASADDAECGDTRKITREVLYEEASYVCRSQTQIENAEQAARDEALDRALERLEKFDGECAALPGRVTELSRNVGADSQLRWHYESVQKCTYDQQGHQICHIEQVPTYQYCEIYGKATVKHRCDCG